jgi:hypothetical protein
VMALTQIDASSLTDQQISDWFASPMTSRELERLAQLQAEMRLQAVAAYKAELQQGEALAELKSDPRLLWQRDEIFQTKRGGWKKTRSWHAFVTHHQLAESGKDADRLIDQWHRYLLLQQQQEGQL